MSVQDRRELLTAAALRVIVRDGVAAATTRAIVAEAGMRLGAFHYCFESREQLLRQVSTRLTDERVAAARAAFAHGRSLRKAISASLKAFWDGVEAGPAEELVGYELAVYALREPGLQELAQYEYGYYLEVHQEFLRTAAETARIEWTVPVEALARYVLATLDGLCLCWLVDRDSDRSLQVLDLLTDYLVSVARPLRR